MEANKNPSSTKKGPGRFHVSGHRKESPVQAKGAPRGFVQRLNSAKAKRRALVNAVGIRQFKKRRRLEREQHAYWAHPDRLLELEIDARIAAAEAAA